MTEIVLGAPGCGKTTTLISIVDGELSNGTPPERIAYLTFTRKAAGEATGRALKKFGFKKSDFPFFSTLHALCYHSLGVKDGDVLEGKSAIEFGKYAGVEVTGKTYSDDGTRLGFNFGDRILFMENLARARGIALADQYRQDDDGLPWSEVDRVSRALKEYKHDNGLIDFTDMLSRFVKSRVRIPIDVLLVDEAQDLSRVQWQVVKMLAKDCRRVVVGGDDDQCHPAGTMILTPKGQTPIEKLKSGDLVIQWDRKGQQTTKAHSVQCSRHWHNGDLVRVNNVESTPDHLWLVRWLNKQSAGYVVYVMKRHNHTRVGWCQLFNAEGTLHIEVRRKLEDADALWILKRFATKQEASFYEQFVSIKYGIPTVMFKATQATILYTQKALNTFFDQYHTLSRWQECLQDHGRDVHFPFLDNSGLNRRRSTLMLVRACNLIDGLVAVPTPTPTPGKRMAVWTPAKITRRKFKGWVYGLDAPPHRYYIANGTITHNCIYRWAGADVDHLIDMDGDVRVLGQSYRVPPAVQAIANNVISPVKHRRDKVWAPRPNVTGTVERGVSFANVMLPQSGSILILARNAYVLREQVTGLLRRRGAVWEQYGHSSINMKLVAAARMWERLRRNEGLCAADVRCVYEFMTSGRGVARGHKTLPGIEDEVIFNESELRTFHGLIAPSAPWFEVLDRVPREDVVYVRAALQSGENLDEKPRITLSTIHSAKGGEADHVIVMKEMASRTYNEMLSGKEGKLDDERRVWYVAATRAREKLTLVESRTSRRCPWL